MSGGTRTDTFELLLDDSLIIKASHGGVLFTYNTKIDVQSEVWYTFRPGYERTLRCCVDSEYLSVSVCEDTFGPSS